MNGKILAGVSISLAALSLVSCQDDRIVDRPITHVASPGTGINSTTLMNNFMGENQAPTAPTLTPGNTLNNLLQDPAPVQPNLNNQISGTGIQPPRPVAPTNTITPPSNNSLPTLPNNNNNAVVPSEKIPVATPTGDPHIVLSPYDRTKKIRITSKDGTPYPSGTVLRDTNFSGTKKFIVP